MKYTFALAALAAVTAAQSISDLPQCSLSCVVTSVQGVGCGPTDIKCACQKADQLTPAVTPCIQKACPSAADQKKVIEVVEGLCAQAGVPINAPPAMSSAAPSMSSAAPAKPSSEAPKSSAPAASGSASYAVSSAPMMSSAASTCTSAVVTVTSTGSPMAPYPTGGMSSAPKPSGTGAYSAPPSYFTGAASAMKVPALAGVLGLAAFAL